MATLLEKLRATGTNNRFNQPDLGYSQLPDSYRSQLRYFTGPEQDKILRYTHIFSNDLTPVLNYIDEMATEGRSNIKNHIKNSSKEDQMKWSDYKYLGDTQYDMMYRKQSPKAVKARKQVITSTPAQVGIGIGTGIWNTIAGTAELGAALADLALDTDTLSKVEKALPAVDLLDIYGDREGSIAKFTSILVQYGTGWGVARKIAQKVIGRMAKKKIAQKVGGQLSKVSIPSLTGTKTGMDIARFGGYWVLPAAVGDAVVSTQANVSLGDVFGKEDGNILQRALMHSKTESLEGLTGKARAAAILRNKLKFGGEGAALFGGMTLVGPSLKGAAWTAGKVLGGQQFGKGLKTPVGTIPTRPIPTPFGEISKVPGLGDALTGITKPLAYQTKAKNPLGLPAGIGVPGLFRIAKKGWSKGMTKLGIPRRELWKFSEFAGGGLWAGLRRAVDDFLLSPLSPSWKFDKGSATAIRKQQNMVRKVKKDFDIWKRNLDHAMYGLVKAGAGDIAFQTRTAMKAMSYWDDVLKYMRGEIKLDALPKSLRLGSRAIRQMIDEQTKALTPIIRDMDIRDELIKNMGKYLHTSYEIFKNSKWRVSKEDYAKGVDYFMNLLRTTTDFKGVRKGTEKYNRMLVEAKQKVNRILEIGRSEGFTPGIRLQKIMNEAAEIKVPANIFKDIKNVPDEIATLLGKVRDPQNIILDTLVEQAHTIHSYNAYRELANQAMGKWIFKNNKEFLDWAAKQGQGIPSPRGLAPITVKKPYNMDLEDIFKNPDGSSMVAIPEMAKAISDQTLLVDIALKFPFWKAALAIKAGTQVNKTVLSLMTQMRNITTASAFAMANGHVGMGASVADNFEHLWKHMVGKHKDPEKLKDLLSEALEAGALDSSTIATELEKMIPELMGPSKVPNIRKTAEQVVGKIKTGKVPDLSDVAGRTVSDVGNVGLISDEIFSRLLTNKGAVGRLVQKSIEAYQLGDNVWKLFGYQFTKSQLKPAFRNIEDVKTYFREVEGFEFNPYKSGSTTAGKNGQNLKTVDDAIKEIAGLQIRDVYPNYSMVPRAVQTIRKIPFFGNFVGFTSEMWRNSYEMLRRGTAEMASSNPYIRQMGARRLLGYTTTVGTLVPITYNIATQLTGVPKEFMEAYKARFGADYQQGHTLIPISKQDKNGKVDAVDADTLHPYSDVQKPFKVYMDTWSQGKKTDQGTLSLFRQAMVDSLLGPSGLLKPFVAKSIAWETLQEVMPDKNGISRSKTGALIADWNNDRDPWSKTMYYIYSKVLPTTLKSGEKIYRAFKGQINKSAIEYDPEKEVAATLAGFRVLTLDPYKSMKYKVGAIGGELSNARKVFINRSIAANTLMDDFARIAEGDAPVNINSEFQNYQKNRYRIWSEAYKDIEALRIMNYTEAQIREMIEGRRTFSADEVSNLLLGRFSPAKVPEINFLKNNGFSAQIKQINRELGTAYSPQEFYNRADLQEIYNIWNNAQLGKGLDEIEEELGVPINVRQRELIEDIEDRRDIIIEQQQEDRQRLLDQQKKIRDRILENRNNQKSSLPIGTPPLDTEIFTASRVYPTNSGTVDQTTGLTRNQTALLSPGEQEIVKRSNQGIGSLT